MVYHQRQIVLLWHDVAEPESEALLFHIFKEIERVAITYQEYRFGLVRFAICCMYLDFQSDDDVAFLSRNVLHRRITVDAFYHDIAIAVPQGIADLSLLTGRPFKIFKPVLVTASLGPPY